jgi:hypothetical protein
MVPLGMRYPEQVASVREVIARVNRRGVKPYVHVDTTGTGRPVTDMLHEGLDGTNFTMSAVTITSGTKLKPQLLGAPEARRRQGTLRQPSSGAARSWPHRATERQGVRRPGP